MNSGTGGASHARTVAPPRGWLRPDDSRSPTRRPPSRRPFEAPDDGRPRPAVWRSTPAVLPSARNRQKLDSGRPQDVVVAGGIVKPTACACAAPTSRRVASLRPRSAGLTALTPAPRTSGSSSSSSCRSGDVVDPLELQPTTQVGSYGVLLRHGPQAMLEPLHRLAEACPVPRASSARRAFSAATAVLPTEINTGHPPSVRPLRYAAFTVAATRCHRCSPLSPVASP